MRLARPSESLDATRAPIALVDTKGELARDYVAVGRALSPANDTFRAVGAMGLSKAGTSAVLSWAANGLTMFEPFAALRGAASFKPQSRSVDLLIEPARRLFLVKAPAVCNPTTHKELGSRGISLPAYCSQFAHLARFNDFCAACGLLSSCSVVFVVVSDGVSATDAGGEGGEADEVDGGGGSGGGGGGGGGVAAHDLTAGPWSPLSLVKAASRVVRGKGWPVARVVVVRNRVPPLRYGLRRVEADLVAARKVLGGDAANVDRIVDVDVDVVHFPSVSPSTLRSLPGSLATADDAHAEELHRAACALQRAALVNYGHADVRLPFQTNACATEAEWLSSFARVWTEMRSPEFFRDAEEWVGTQRARAPTKR